MKKVLVVVASLTLVAASALAQNANDLNPKAGHHATNPVVDHDNNGNNGACGGDPSVNPPPPNGGGGNTGGGNTGGGNKIGRAHV